MQNQKSNSRTFTQLLRRSWLPVAVVTLAAVLLFTGQPAWAADGALNIGQTVPTPTPALDPVAPTATPLAPTTAPEEAATPDEEATATPEAAPESGAAAAPVDVAAEGGAAAPAATFTSTLTGTVTALTLNVRQGPSTTFPVIGRLTAGANTTVLARNLDGAWLLICCTANGSNGWVSAQFVEPSYSAAEAASLIVTNTIVTTSTVTSPITGTVTAPTTPLSGTGAVNVLTLNIRQGPSTTPPVVGRFRQGDTVTLLGANAAGDWYQVCCVPGTQNPGWVSAQFVTVGADAAAPEVATPAATAPEEVATPEAGATEATPTPEATDSQTSQSNTGVTDVLW